MFRRNKPADLHKKLTLKQKLNDVWCQYGYIFFIIACLIILFAAVYLCYAFVPPVESGVYYNHLGK